MDAQFSCSFPSNNVIDSYFPIGPEVVQVREDPIMSDAAVASLGVKLVELTRTSCNCFLEIKISELSRNGSSNEQG